MDSSLKHFFDELHEFEIRQSLGVSEPYEGAVSKVFKRVTYQAPTEYKLYAKDNESLGLVQEYRKEGSVPFWYKHYHLGKRRPLTFIVSNQNHDVILYLKRPFHILASTTIVKSEDHEILAYIWERFDPVYRKYEFRNANKRLVASIKAPILKPWTFPICNLQKKEIGLIQKKMPSLGEYMTYRETLKVKCSDMSLEHKIMTLAVALTICIDVFEPR